MKPAPADIYVILPVYNEGQVLAPILETLIERGYSIVAVDDGSKDDSWDILQQYPIACARHPINLGQGAALQTGMDIALRLGAQYLVHFDSDGQHTANEIEHMIALLASGEVDVVLGSRFLSADTRRLVPLVKQIVLRFSVIVNGLLTGVWLTDVHNGFRAMTADAARHIRLRENRYAHASEIYIQIRKHGLRYREVPTTITYSSYAIQKGQPIWNAFNILIDVVLREVFR
jgi:polyprenyl-phospho-N-acetylgalactosaminyl synthase